MINIVKNLIQLIYPPKCVFCGKLTQADKEYCSSCVSYLPKDYCYLCEKWWKSCSCGLNYGRVFTPMEYTGIVRNKLIRLKTQPDERLAKVLAHLMAKCYEAKGGNQTILMAVPTSKDRLKERGFNQTELLTKYLGRELNLKHDVSLLARKTQSLAQHNLGYEARFKNAEESYYLCSEKDLTDINVIIVDDIVTTGATLEACAKALLPCNPKEIISLCAARTLKNKKENHEKSV